MEAEKIILGNSLKMKKNWLKMLNAVLDWFWIKIKKEENIFGILLRGVVSEKNKSEWFFSYWQAPRVVTAT